MVAVLDKRVFQLGVYNLCCKPYFWTVTSLKENSKFKPQLLYVEGHHVITQARQSFFVKRTTL